MKNSQVLITYDGLPISAGGAHTIRVRDHHAIWKSISQFLEVFTTYQSADDVHLVLYEGQDIQPEFFSQAREQAIQAYGVPERSVVSADGTEEYQNLWTLKTHHISSAIDLMTSLKPFPKHYLGGPMFLGVKSTFRLVDPDTSQLLPFQDNEIYGGQEADFERPLGLSVIYLRFAQPSTCALFLSLPFGKITPELEKYICRVEEILPFKLSNKHWSRWQLNSKGTRYYNRKISR